MANIDAPMGFNPVRNPGGTTIQANQYSVTTTVAVAPGTICYLTDAGTVQGYTGTATGAKALLGAAIGSVSATAADRNVLISDAVDQEYMVQCDDNAVTLITSLIGANFAGTNIATVNTTLIQSRGELDASSLTSINTATAIRPFRGKRFATQADNDQSLSWGNVIVQINSFNHVFGSPITVSATLSNTGVL